MPKQLLLPATQLKDLPVKNQYIDVDKDIKQNPLKYGLIPKPSDCQECPYTRIGKGFCPDWKSPVKEPLIAMVLEAPGIDEIHSGQPLVGRAGRFWLHMLVEKLGYTRDDILICNTLRCHPPNDKYPIGKTRKEAEKLCRAYDDKLRAFNPDLFLVTAHPAMLLRASAMYRLVLKDLEKAFNFAKQGFKPCVLMGDKAMGVYAPWIDGGVKRWRGHVWEADLNTTRGHL